MSKRICLLFLSAFAVCLFLSGCVDQHPEKSTEAYTAQGNGQTGAVEAAREKVIALGRAPRIVATSPAAAQICEKLELNLVGVCSSTAEIPDRYQDLPTIGTAMSPDMEILASLSPDWILSPSSLQSDLQSKYETLNSDWAFLNLRSVPGMYQSIEELGVIFDREQQARELTDEYQEFYQNFQEEIAGKEHPKVLILMGLPGSYVIATEMKTKKPDIILRAAHALPDQVAEMFAEDFKTNDIWKHFQAVKDGKVYDLPYEQFGMSATFAYQDALETLKKLLYTES